MTYHHGFDFWLRHKSRNHQKCNFLGFVHWLHSGSFRGAGIQEFQTFNVLKFLNSGNKYKIHSVEIWRIYDLAKLAKISFRDKLWAVLIISWALGNRACAASHTDTIFLPTHKFWLWIHNLSINTQSSAKHTTLWSVCIHIAVHSTLKKVNSRNMHEFQWRAYCFFPCCTGFWIIGNVLFL